MQYNKVNFGEEISSLTLSRYVDDTSTASPLPTPPLYLIAENGDFFITEGGDFMIAEQPSP